MKDIPEDLGVSLMTVSKGLRNQPDVGEETRQRILRRAKELNCVPNGTARSVATDLIGLVVPDLLHPFFADVAHGLAMTLRQEGYFLIVTSSEEAPGTGKERDRAVADPKTGRPGDCFGALQRKTLPEHRRAKNPLYPH